MRSKIGLLVVGVVLVAQSVAGGGGVAISTGPVVVDTTVRGEATVSVDVTNTGTARIKVDLNVIALGDCAGDVSGNDAYDCSRGAWEVSSQRGLAACLPRFSPRRRHPTRLACCQKAGTS